MINFGKIASNVLNSIDNAAKESLDEVGPKQANASRIRALRKQKSATGISSDQSDSNLEGSHAEDDDKEAQDITDVIDDLLQSHWM